MVFFTICSANFLGYAHALHEGLRAYHPDANFTLVLCDDPTAIDIESCHFPIVTIEKLGIPSWERMVEHYNITELNTSVKPFAFLYLFDQYPDDPVVYLDPDIHIVSELTELYETFAQGAECVLTPHLLEPAEFAEMDDLRILQFGVYNLGFCGLRGTPEVRRAVAWWGRRLEAHCIIDLAAGLFVDQKWAELLPAYIERSVILRHPGYNVAYWNLSQRRVVRQGAEWRVNGRPLRFFHFSGNIIEDESIFARHSQAFTIANIGAVRLLLGEYRRHVLARGHGYYSGLPFAFSWTGAQGENLHTPSSLAQARGSAERTPYLPLLRAHSLAEFVAGRSAMAEVIERREQAEMGMIPRDSKVFTVTGYCACCRKDSEFQVSDQYSTRTLPDGRPVPNWREHLACLSCGLQNRVRAAMQILSQEFSPKPTDRIYLTEQKTRTFEWLRARFQRVEGSEYFPGEHRSGEFVDGIRHEDIQNLSFESERFDFVLSFDVLEHVPDYARAFRELHRCLAPDGVLLFSVPFRWARQEHEVRARLGASGEVEHILEPEYHGNPVDPEGGSLCFRYFGWEVLEELREVGFAEAQVWSYWSRSLAYLGDPQLVIVARKSGRGLG